MRRAAMLALVCAGSSLGAATLATATTRGAHPHASRSARRHHHASRPPAHFASCASLVRFGEHYLAATHGIPETPVQPLPGSVGAPTLTPAPAPPATSAPPASSAPSAGTSFSTTNNQEPGVEEPDSVKTNGSTIFAVSGNHLYAVDVTGGAPRLVGSLDLGSAGLGAQLLLDGDRLIVISSTGPIEALPPGAPLRGTAGPPLVYPSPYYYRSQTTIERVDVSNPAAMQVIGRESIDGSFIDARQNGDTARIVISAAPTAIANPELRSRVAGYLPIWHYHGLLSGRRMHGLVARCSQVARPQVFSGLGTVTILTVDIAHGLAFATTDTLMADAQVVYGSPSNIYLATEKWINPATPATKLPTSSTTQIDRFDASVPGQTTFVATGDVPGFLLNQFSLSESGGYLRVATTSRPDFWGDETTGGASQSYVTVLATNGDQLVPVGQLSGLGSGQKIYSVRFVGDVGYVVTFHQVDPLYTIDLSDPTAPKVASQLELQGYSSYLHPLPDGLLLGVGQDVGSTSEPMGAQLELFDVSNPSAPVLLQKTSLGQGSSSQAQYDHHAFLYWDPTHLAVLPVQTYPVYPGPPTSSPGATGTTSPAPPPGGSTAPFTGAIGFRVDRSGISEVGEISHPASNGYAPPITRSIVIGDQLYTLSAEGILASRLDTLAPLTFVAFPPPPQPTAGSGAAGSGTVKPTSSRSASSL